MGKRSDKLARAIRSFVENPVTNLVKGLALLLIGLSDASHTFREDVSHGQLRVGHGLIIIGVFSILGALPHLIESLDAGARYLELREQKKQTKKEPDDPSRLKLRIPPISAWTLLTTAPACLLFGPSLRSTRRAARTRNACPHDKPSVAATPQS